MQRHIDSTEHMLGAQASDDKIVARFDALMGRIRTWSCEFTLDVPNSESIVPSQEKLDIYHQVNASCRTWEGLQMVLKDKKKRRLFARGLVAYVISNTIFRRRDSLSPPPRILESKDCKREEFWLEEPLRGCLYWLERNLDTPGLSWVPGTCAPLTIFRWQNWLSRIQQLESAHCGVVDKGKRREGRYPTGH